MHIVNRQHSVHKSASQSGIWQAQQNSKYHTHPLKLTRHIVVHISQLTHSREAHRMLPGLLCRRGNDYDP